MDAECNELQCTNNNNDLWHAKKLGIVVRHIKGNVAYTCFKVWYLFKLGIMHSETSHVLYSVIAFGTLPSQFALFNEALFRLLLEYRHFQHWYFSFLNLEIFISPEIINVQTEIKVSTTKLTTNQLFWISTWMEFIRPCNCGEHSVLWQTAPLLIYLFSWVVQTRLTKKIVLPVA